MRSGGRSTVCRCVCEDFNTYAEAVEVRPPPDALSAELSGTGSRRRDGGERFRESPPSLLSPLPPEEGAFLTVLMRGNRCKSLAGGSEGVLESVSAGVSEG